MHSGDDFSRFPSFRLPSFEHVPTARYRQDIKVVEQAGHDWLRRHLSDVYRDEAGLERFVGQNTALWELLAYSTVHSDRILDIVTWNDLMFSLDDALVEDPPQRARHDRFEQYQDVLDGRQGRAETPYLKVFALTVEQGRSRMAPGLWIRFAESLKLFLSAAFEERAFKNQPVDIATYHAYRDNSVGVSCMPALEYGLDIDLTDYLADPTLPLDHLGVLVRRHWMYVNDIFSYRKELYAGDTMNWIWKTTQGDPAKLQSAVDSLADRANDTASEFFNTSGQLAETFPEAEHPVRRYLEGLALMMSGNLEWSYLTTRYHGEGHVWNGVTEGPVFLAPQRTVFPSGGSPTPGPP